MNLCKCGCKQECNNIYVRGHTWKNRKQTKSHINKRTETVLGQKRPELSKKRKGKGNPMFGKKPWNYNLTKETDIRVKKNTESPERIRKISESLKIQHSKGKRKESYKKISLSKMGHIVSKETRKKLRIKTAERLIKFGTLKIGKNEKRILDELELNLKYKIIRQYPIEGYFLDGYIPELNLVIEIDEKYHNLNKWLKRDIKRQKEIENKLNCKFLRIKDE